jgi:hypothetical protein
LIDTYRWPPAIIQVESNVLAFWSDDENTTEGDPMEKKWRVGDVELEGGLLFGLVLHDQKGKPCVSFGYQTEAKANAGRNHVMAALNGVEEVLCG